MINDTNYENHYLSLTQTNLEFLLHFEHKKMNLWTFKEKNSNMSQTNQSWDTKNRLIFLIKNVQWHIPSDLKQLTRNTD